MALVASQELPKLANSGMYELDDESSSDLSSIDNHTAHVDELLASNLLPSTSTSTSSPPTQVSPTSPTYYSSKPMIECGICEEHTSCYQRLSCRHAVCDSCLGHMVEAVLLTGANNYNVSCPECHTINTSNDVYQVIDATLRERLRMQHQRARQQLEEQQLELEICYCPRTRCGAQLYVPSDAKRATCTECQHELCCTCLEAHSRWTPCLVSEVGKCIAQPSRAATQTRKLLSTKPCPRCGNRIEKNGGCSHMRCRACDFYFCWRCSHDLSKGGSHCIMYWTAVATGAVVTAPVWGPPALLGLGAYWAYGLVRSRRRRQQRQRNAW
jgi:hypothetical protein